MQGFLLTQKGAECIAAEEVKQLVKATASINEYYITFPAKLEDLCLLAYQSQAAHRVGLLLETTTSKVNKKELEPFLKKGTTFAVRSVLNETKEPSQELEKDLGAAIVTALGNKVDLKNPDVLIVVIATKKKTFIGIDFGGFDLSKREYNVFASPSAVKGTTAFALTKLAHFDEKKTLVDPFSGSGIIPIEATLHATKFPARYYNKNELAFLKLEQCKNFDFNKIDKKIKKTASVFNVDGTMKHISFAKKNAKIAGIDKQLQFSRQEADRLDLKFQKNTVDCIVSKLPTIAKDLKALYKELFYQAEFILKNKGTMVLIAKEELVKKNAQEFKFAVEKTTLQSGQQEHNVFIIHKEKYIKP